MSTTLLEEPFDVIPTRSSRTEHERGTMRLVSCLIRPERLEAVKEALGRLDLVGGVTITDVRGFGRQKGQVEHYRGGEYTIRFIPKVRLDVAVRAGDVEAVTAAVGQAARTGSVGDGKIFVTGLLSATRIRTGERGVVAL